MLQAITRSQTLSKVSTTREYCITTAGVVVTLPTPTRFTPRKGVPFQNSTAGYVTLAAPSGYYFIPNVQQIVLPPYATILLYTVEDGSTYYWAAAGNHIRSEELITWAPTLTWTTADPPSASMTQSWHAWVHQGVCFFIGYVSNTDGNGATALTITLPIRPANTANYIPIVSQVIVDGTDTDALGRVDCADATNTNRVIEFDAFPTWTDAKTCSLWVAGFYEVHGAGWAATTQIADVEYVGSNATAWAGSNLTEIFRCKSIEGDKGNSAMLFTADIRTDDDAAGVTSSITIKPPTYPLDTDVYVPIIGHDKCTDGSNAIDYDNMLPLLDCANATEASRIATTNKIGVCADNKAAEAYFAGIYEHYGWDAFTPGLTWTATTAPTASANVGRFTVIDGICHFHCYCGTLDGNNASGLVIELDGLPTPRYLGCKTPLISMETYNTSTDKNPHAKLRTDQQADSDRPFVNFDDFTAMTDGAPAYVYVAGFYPV